MIVACGAIRSPHLLQLSGVGPGALLQSLGIPIVAQQESVGQNLRDHYSVRLTQRVAGMGTLNERTRGLGLAGELLNYAFLGRGLLTTGASSAAAFARSTSARDFPDLQLSFAPGSFEPGTYRLERKGGMTINVYHSFPDSRGTVQARSANAADAPAIHPGYLTAPADEAVMLAGLRLGRRIFSMPALRRWGVQETLPGPEVESDEALLRLRARERRLRLPPGRHLPHGRRRGCRGRRTLARARRAGPARDRCFHPAHGHFRKLQRPHADDGGKRRGDGAGRRMNPHDTEFDVIVLGAGGGGMATALFAAIEGMKVLLVERTRWVGGTTALAAGAMWIPNTHLAEGSGDTPAKAAHYLQLAAPNGREDLRRRFLELGPAAVKLLEAHSEVRMRAFPHHPDYLTELEDATSWGRVLECLPFDGRQLGAEFALVRPPIPEFTVLGGMMVDRIDIGHLLNLTRSRASFAHSTRLLPAARRRPPALPARRAPGHGQRAGGPAAGVAATARRARLDGNEGASALSNTMAAWTA